MGVLKDCETFLVSAEQLVDNGIPSVSMALLEDPSGTIQNHVITTGNENPDTIYQACSISKAITAIAVARLIDQGVLTYDTKVVDHVPKDVLSPILDSKTEHLMHYVTVGLLISHRSGLSQHGYPGYAGDPPTGQQVFGGLPPVNTPRLRFISFPGSQMAYSGGGLTVLQVLLEHITGVCFAELMHDTVLIPLGMSRSRFGDLEDSENDFAKASCNGHMLGTAYSKGYHRFAELAAAGLWTTPSDLVRAVSAVQRSLHSKDGYLTQATAKAMLTRSPPEDTGLQMALGWGVDEFFFGHAGDNDPGYQCYVVSAHTAVPASPQLYSTRLMSLAIMTNSVNGFTAIRKLVAGIFTLKGWPRVEYMAGGFGKASTIIPYCSPEGVPDGRQWKAFEGHWAAETSDKTTDSSPSRTLAEVQSNLGKDCRQYELFEADGLPMLGFDGIGEAMRLRFGTIPYLTFDGKTSFTYVVDGLEMALRLYHCDDGTKKIDLVQEEVTTLERV